jgi:hypothetical protein
VTAITLELYSPSIPHSPIELPLSLAPPLIRACFSDTTSQLAMAPHKRKIIDKVAKGSAKRQKADKTARRCCC